METSSISTMTNGTLLTSDWSAQIRITIADALRFVGPRLIYGVRFA